MSMVTCIRPAQTRVKMSCRFIMNRSMLTRVVLNVLLWPTYSRWHRSYCTNLFTRVHADMCHSSKMFTEHVPTLVPFRTIRNIIVRVEPMTHAVQYKLLLHTCSNWHMSYCTNVYFTGVNAATFHTVHMFSIDVSTMTRSEFFKLLSCTYLRGYVS